MNLELVERTEKEIQAYLYEVGKRHFGFEKSILNLWFKCLYTIFFGYSDGPRMGVFINLYGLEAFLDRLEERCENPLGV